MPSRGRAVKERPTSGNAAPNPARANGPARASADCAARARLAAELEAVVLELEDLARRGVPDTLAQQARATLERLRAEFHACRDEGATSPPPAEAPAAAPESLRPIAGA